MFITQKKLLLWDDHWSPVQKRRSGLKRYPTKVDFDWWYLRFWQRDEWQDLVRPWFNDQRQQGKIIIPGSYPTMFRCLEECNYEQTKIVILGQDPYPTPGHADGLAFSVLPNLAKIPGSLRNIFAEYRSDLGFNHPRSGSLSTWARNGILLMNSLWSVEAGKPGSHEEILGIRIWQKLTEEIIDQLSLRKDKLVFILWGKKAQEWSTLIDKKKHLVLEGAHPSPMNARGKYDFYGGNYFSRACEYLDLATKIWRLP